MPEPSVLESNLSAGEVSVALDRLSRADKLRLLAIARNFSYGTGLEPDELFQEAIMRALAGVRQCPSSVDFTVFLAGVMRSIANAQRKAGARERASIQRKQELAMHSDAPPPSVGDELVRAETEAESKQTVDAIFGLFSTDEEAQLVLLADFDGLTAAEIRALNGMDEKALATVRRRIRRGIQKAYPKGWKL